MGIDLMEDFGICILISVFLILTFLHTKWKTISLMWITREIRLHAQMLPENKREAYLKEAIDDLNEGCGKFKWGTSDTEKG